MPTDLLEKMKYTYTVKLKAIVVIGCRPVESVAESVGSVDSVLKFVK